MPLIAAENAEVTGGEHLERGAMNDEAGNEETSNEIGERHRGRSVLRTVNEDKNFIAIHNDLVGHDKEDGMEENKKSRGTKWKRKHIHRSHVDCRRGDCKRIR